MQDLVQHIYWKNTVLDYLIVAGWTLLVSLLVKFFKKYIIQLLQHITSKTENKFDDQIVIAAERFLIPYAYFFINYALINTLTLSPKVERVLSAGLSVITIYYAVRFINYFFHSLVLLYMRFKNEPEERIKQLNGVLVLIKVLIWVAGFIMLLDNLGYNVTTIIAGLGVGGIAIALAAQNILSDLFSYLVIFFDKPFEIGDFIVVGNTSGVIERIGIKTSHLRSLDGQQLVMPNAELVKSTIHNFKRMERRRVVSTIGVVYQTTSQQLHMLPSIIKETVNGVGATFDRAHLKSFGDFAINFEYVFYIETPDYLVYMNTVQAINLTLFEKFEQLGIEFAYPSQTIYLYKNKLDTITNKVEESC
jgi:small-conductance mechanosensitive channel